MDGRRDVPSRLGVTSTPAGHKGMSRNQVYLRLMERTSWHTCAGAAEHRLWEVRTLPRISLSWDRPAQTQTTA